MGTRDHDSFFVMVMYVMVPFTCDAADGMRVKSVAQSINQSSSNWLATGQTSGRIESMVQCVKHRYD